jgi:hypothetical protein
MKKDRCRHPLASRRSSGCGGEDGTVRRIIGVDPGRTNIMVSSGDGGKVRTFDSPSTAGVDTGMKALVRKANPKPEMRLPRTTWTVSFEGYRRGRHQARRAPT